MEDITFSKVAGLGLQTFQTYKLQILLKVTPLHRFFPCYTKWYQFVQSITYDSLKLHRCFSFNGKAL